MFSRRKALDNQKEVFQTANTLVASGKKITLTILHDALSEENLTTIYKYRQLAKNTTLAATRKTKKTIYFTFDSL